MSWVQQQRSKLASPASTTAPAGASTQSNQHLRSQAPTSAAGPSAAAELAGIELAEHPGETRQETPGSGLSEAELDAQRPEGTPIPTELRDRMLATLRTTPAMTEVLAAIAAAGTSTLDVRWSRRGGYHSRGRIFLDRNATEPSWLSTLAHELVHLQAYVEGKSADVRTQTRDAYVDTHMTEEIRAHATTFIALMQLGRLSAPTTGFNDFIAHLEQQRPDLLASFLDPAEEAQKWADVRALAEPWLEDQYRNHWVGSATGQNYYQKWGAHWDAQHPSP
jgi:hypothetical protein